MRYLRAILFIKGWSGSSTGVFWPGLLATWASHYLFEPVACTPASGWEKGQVENQVGNIREWLFTPTPRFAKICRAE